MKRRSASGYSARDAAARLRSRWLVLLTVVLGLGSILVAGFLGRHQLLERWYIVMLESDDPAWQLTAIARLREIRSTSAARVLVQRLRHVGQEQARAILETVSGMGPAAAGAAPALVRFLDEAGELNGYRVSRVLESMGQAGFQAMLDEGPRSDAGIRWRVSAFAENLGRSVPFLLEQLASKSPRKSALCARILEEFGQQACSTVPEFAPGIAPHWSRLWNSNDPLVRQWMANVAWNNATERLGHADYLPATVGPLLDPDVRGRDLSQAAANLVADLMHLGLRKREALARFWLEKDCTRLRRDCLRAVAREPWTALAYIPQLCAWLSGEVSLRSAAFDALSAIGPTTVPMAGYPAEDGGPVISGLVHALHSENASGKRWAHILLVEMGLKSPEARAAIEAALPGAGPLARPWIEKVLLRVRSAGGR